jgi:hypothetical protein
LAEDFDTLFAAARCRPGADRCRAVVVPAMWVVTASQAARLAAYFILSVVLGAAAFFIAGVVLGLVLESLMYWFLGWL